MSDNDSSFIIIIACLVSYLDSLRKAAAVHTPCFRKFSERGPRTGPAAIIGSERMVTILQHEFSTLQLSPRREWVARSFQTTLCLLTRSDTGLASSCEDAENVDDDPWQTIISLRLADILLAIFDKFWDSYQRLQWHFCSKDRTDMIPM